MRLPDPAAAIMTEMLRISQFGFANIMRPAEVCSTLVTFWVRNNLPAALVLSGAALVLTAVLQWFCFVVLPEQGSAAAVLFGHALPSAVFSFLFSVPLCWLVQRTAKAFSAPESAV